MMKLDIYDYQAKQIEDTLRKVAKYLNTNSSLNRDVLQSWQMIRNVISGDIDKKVPRIK